MTIDPQWALNLLLLSLMGLLSWIGTRINDKVDKHDEALGKVLTREEHTEICEKRNSSIQRTLEEIKERMEDDREHSMEYRERQSERIAKMGEQVATLIERTK